MGGAVEIANLVRAQLLVDLPAGATDPTVVQQRGFVAGNGTRSGVGVYVFDLNSDDGIDPDATLVLTGSGATAAPAGRVVTAEVAAGTPDQLTLRTFAVDGTPADVGVRAAVEVHVFPSNA